MPSDDAAPWLATMRGLSGVKEYAGGENNPTILGWARFIGGAYPEMEGYAALYKSDDISWCGLCEAYALAKNGIRPPFGSSDTERFLWANSFPGWGLRLDEPRPGAIVVFKWASGGGHVGTIDRVAGKTLYVVGGNQSDAVNVLPFAWDKQVVGFFWPPEVAAQPSAVRTPADVKMRMGKAIVRAEERRDARGNLAVYYLPANDGGGTYEVAGINDRFHPIEAAKLKAMIEQGRYQEAEDFVGQFIGAYTDVADLWTSSWGIEFDLRDCVFNRGPTGAALILQLALKRLGEDLGTDGRKANGVDGEVGPLTTAAMRRQESNVEQMLTALRAAREEYERTGNQYIDGGPHRDESSTFWHGLVNRWNGALTVARQFQAEQPKETPVTDQTTGVTNEQVVKEMQEGFAQITTVLGAILSALKGTAPVTVPIAEPKPVIVPDPVPVAPKLPTPGLATGTGIMTGALAIIMQLLGYPVVGEGASTATSAIPAVAIGSAALGLSGFGGVFSNLLGGVAQWALSKITPSATK